MSLYRQGSRPSNANSSNERVRPASKPGPVKRPVASGPTGTNLISDSDDQEDDEEIEEIEDCDADDQDIQDASAEIWSAGDGADGRGYRSTWRVSAPFGATPTSSEDSQGPSDRRGLRASPSGSDPRLLRAEETCESYPEPPQPSSSSGKAKTVSHLRPPSPYDRLAPRPIGISGSSNANMSMIIPGRTSNGPDSVPKHEAGSPPISVSSDAPLFTSSATSAPAPPATKPAGNKAKLHPLFASTSALFNLAERAGKGLAKGLMTGYAAGSVEVVDLDGDESPGGVKDEPDVNMEGPDEAGPSVPGGFKMEDQRPASSRITSTTTTTDGAGPIVEEVIVLSEEQEKVLRVAMSGKSMFFTGSAGTGKSVLLRALIQSMRNTPVMHPGGELRTRKVAVTASTGIAALNIGGCTLHSWAGVGLGEEAPHVLYKKILLRGRPRAGGKTIKLRVPGSIKSNSRFGGRQGQMEDVQAGSALARWLMDDVLIIDEISMIDGRFFDKLEQIGRMTRGNSEPFGGIQVILCGDFFQLPPVPDRHTKTSVFAFQAETWGSSVPNMFTLQKVFRQKNQAFADMLNEARMGLCSPRSSRRFASLERVVEYNDGIQATELFPLRYQAEKANQCRLDELMAESIMYNAMDVPGRQADGTMYSYPDAVKLLDQHCRAPQTMELKIGAQVMLTTNLSPTLANGSLGIIVGFETVTSAKVEKPSRDGDDEEGFAKFRRPAKPEAKKGPQIATRWPVVEFAGASKMVIPAHEFDVTSVTGILEAQRIQVPLILAWALSIHKAQGITLPRMKVDMEKIFEKGQAYVALSRATSLDTLELRHFKPSKIYAHPAVIEWSRSLSAVGKGDNE